MTDYNEHPIALEIFFDGLGLGPKNAMSPEYADEARGYLQYPKPYGYCGSEHIVTHALRSSVTKLNEAFKWITDALANTDLSLDFKLDDTPIFFAQCSVGRDFPNRELIIYVGLGCVPVFVGITNRLLHLQQAGPLMLEIEMQGRRTHSQATVKWHPATNPVGTLTYDYIHERNTSSSTTDAMLLIFFHEIAHALRGHFWIPCTIQDSSDSHRRALESDADWCAGYLFIKFHFENLFDKEPPSQEYQLEISERLALASASLNCALQVLRKENSKKYHLPYTRSLDNFFGAEFAWNELGVSFNFIESLNTAYSQLKLLDNLLDTRLSPWVSAEDSLSLADMDEREKVTEPIKKRLLGKMKHFERGAVNGAGSEWRTPFQRRPDYRQKSFYVQQLDDLEAK